MVPMAPAKPRAKPGSVAPAQDLTFHSDHSEARGTRQMVRIYTTHTPPRSADRGQMSADRR